MRADVVCRERAAMIEPRYLTVEGVRTAVFEAGEGPPLVLLHGMAGDAGTWRYTFDALRDGYRVIVPDLPLHGHSDGVVHPYGFDSLTAWLDALLEALDVDAFTLAGHSMGGAVALAYTLARPERVERLIIVDGLAASRRLPGDSPAGWLHAAQWAVRGLITRRIDMPFLKATEIVHSADGPAREPLREMLANGRRRHYENIRASLRLVLHDYYPRRKRHALAAGRASIDAPVLIVWGAYDGIFPLGHAYEAAEAIPGARLYVCSRSAHAPMLEEPEVFNAALSAFLADARPAGD
jgi:pimeloyl-ACP methyl ester carboxylesterase